MTSQDSSKLFPKQYTLPNELLCDEHKDLPDLFTQWPLYRQIEDLRRKECRCLIDGLYQWYDLIGQHKDPEN